MVNNQPHTHLISRGYLLGPNPLVKNSNRGVEQLGYHPNVTTIFPMTCLIFHVFATTLKSVFKTYFGWLIYNYQYKVESLRILVTATTFSIEFWILWTLYFVDPKKPSRIEYFFIIKKSMDSMGKFLLVGASGLRLPKKGNKHHGTTESAAFNHKKSFRGCLGKIQGW